MTKIVFSILCYAMLQIVTSNEYKALTVRCYNYVEQGFMALTLDVEGGKG